MQAPRHRRRCSRRCRPTRGPPRTKARRKSPRTLWASRVRSRSDGSGAGAFAGSGLLPRGFSVSTELYPSSPRRDLQGGAVWAALGCVVVVLFWQMDRMTQQGATLHTAPGLWPGIVGALLAVLGGALMLRSWLRARRIGWGARAGHANGVAPPAD